MDKTMRDPLKSVNDYEDFLKSVYDIAYIFSSEEYRKRRESTLCAYPVILKISEPFLRSVKDIEMANSINIPDYGKAICFPYRFLGKSSVSALPKQVGDKLSNALDDIFFSGLNFHFFWATFPTRKESNNVDIHVVKSKWMLEALIADKVMGEFYQGEGGKMAKNIFDFRYSTTCEPLFKQDIKVAFFKRGMCKPFFNNIYWSGALLGLQYDMATK